MGLTEVHGHEDLVSDLAEDLATRWVPDVLADVDIAETVLDARIDDEAIRLVTVPRANGGARHVPVLSGSALGALRKSVEPLRRISEEALDPAVCGYRMGATGDVSYSEEYRRFRSFTEALGEESSWVIVADVRNFFDSVTPETVRLALRNNLEVAAEPIIDLLRQLRSEGVAGLPAGYGDARLIANAVLAPVDRALGVPFTRWVDDYRIFVSSRAEADRVVGSLRKALDQLGLALNESKLEITLTLDYRHIRHGAPLDSVYHPQDESEDVVRTALRSVFISAASTGDRRKLRFALPRLAQEHDSVAVDYALLALHASSIDAPRLVHYLATFVEDPGVAMRVRGLMLDPDVSDWVLMRIVPLLYRIDLDEVVLSAISRRVSTTDSSLLWGLLIRLLAVHRPSATLDLASRPEQVRDHRALAAAYADLGSDVPESLRTTATESAARALARRVTDDVRDVPLPRIDSLL